MGHLIHAERHTARRRRCVPIPGPRVLAGEPPLQLCQRGRSGERRRFGVVVLVVHPHIVGGVVHYGAMMTPWEDCLRHVQAMQAEFDLARERGVEPDKTAIGAHADQAIMASRAAEWTSGGDHRDQPPGAVGPR